MSEIAIRTAINKVPLCGCGSSTEMWAIVRDVLARAAVPHAELYVPGERKSFYDPMPEHDLSAIAVEFVAQALSQAGFLEHGSSIGFAWLSGAGRLLLDFLRQHGTEQRGMDDPKWPEWAWTCDPEKEEFSLSDKAWRELANSHGGDDSKKEASFV